LSSVPQNLTQYIHCTSLFYKSEFNLWWAAQKQKAVWGVVIEFWGGQQKRESVVCSWLPW